MQDDGVLPDRVTYICIIKACGSLGNIRRGEKLHAEMGGQKLLGNDVPLGNALVDMYAKCGELAKAQEVFDELPTRNIIGWTALIAGYAQHGLCREALKCFDHMQEDRLFPNIVTFTCLLKACGNKGDAEKGKSIHTEMSKQGLLGKDMVLETGLIDMYAKCGALVEAQEVFDKLAVRDAISWTSIITGYAQHGLDDRALECFEQMQDEGFLPDVVTFICVLKACGGIGNIKMGRNLHAEMSRQGLLGGDIALGNALVDMYAKCGALGEVQQVFIELPEWNAISWNTLMAGYAQLGKVERVLATYKTMTGHVEPDAITFIALLTAFSHVGLVQEGQKQFISMSTFYSIMPTSEHHACMVDLFGRAGHFDKAINTAMIVPPPDLIALWVSLLGACQKWMDLELGKWVFQHVLQLDEKHASAHICMSNILVNCRM